MKTNYFRTLLTVVTTALLCAMTFISALAFETKKRTKGQDVGDSNCERIDTPESSTFGKCKSVCKDKDVTWDAVGRRYVCSASRTVSGHPFGTIKTGGTLVQDTGVKSTPKAPSAASTKKSAKAKKH